MEPTSPALADRFFTTEPPGKPYWLLASIESNFSLVVQALKLALDNWPIMKPIRYHYYYGKKGGFPGGSDGKESAYNVGDLGSTLGLARSPGGGHGNPFLYSSLKNPQGQRSLVGYSPWGHKELDMTATKHSMTKNIIPTLQKTDKK